MSNARFHEKSQNSVRLQFFTVSPTDYLAALGDPGKGVLLGSSQNKLGLQIFTVSATDYLTALGDPGKGVLLEKKLKSSAFQLFYSLFGTKASFRPHSNKKS